MSALLIIVFENAYIKSGKSLVEENIVIVEGRLSIREDDTTTIIANEIKNFVAKKNKDEFMKTQNEEYNLKKAENKKIKVNNKALFSQGIDNEATNNEIRKLISKITPKPYNFVWSCETVDSYKLAHTNGEGKNIVKKCTVNTDIGITFKATCTYTILSKETGYTLCAQGL